MKCSISATLWEKGLTGIYIICFYVQKASNVTRIYWVLEQPELKHLLHPQHLNTLTQHTYAHTHTHTHTHTRAYSYTRTCTYTRTHSHTRAHSHLPHYAAVAPSAAIRAPCNIVSWCTLSNACDCTNKTHATILTYAFVVGKHKYCIVLVYSLHVVYSRMELQHLLSYRPEHFYLVFYSII